MFASKWMTSFRWDKRTRVRRAGLERSREVDTVAEQVKQVLQTADQKLILMVRS